MKIRVINGFLDRDKGRIIEKDETANLDENKAKKLIALGLAVELEETPAPAGQEDPAESFVDEDAIDENGNFSVDGKVIGHVEGEDIVITDPEVIEETLKAAPADQEEKAAKKKQK